MHTADRAARRQRVTGSPIAEAPFDSVAGARWPFEPAAPTEHRTGYLADAVRADFTDLDGAKAYLAGPPIMVESVAKLLQERGLHEDNIYADAY